MSDARPARQERPGRPARPSRAGARSTSASRDGRIARLERRHRPDRGAPTVVDGGGKLAFPGVVDAHQHWGIYNPLAEDAATESRACAQGGVTTALTYMRTGQYYLNKGGPYAEFFPEVLDAAEGRALHRLRLPPRADDASEHIDEIPDADRASSASPSFKIFMFYGSHGLHGRSADQSSFLMIPEGERYDYAHFEFVMRGIQAAREQFPELADEISLSLHCETAEIMTRLHQAGRGGRHAHRPGGLQRLAAAALRGARGHASPPTSRTRPGCRRSTCCTCRSRKAIEAALLMARGVPAHRLPPRGHRSATCWPTSTPRTASAAR